MQIARDVKRVISINKLYLHDFFSSLPYYALSYTCRYYSSIFMDLFIFYPASGVLLCKPCGYAVSPTTLTTYIKAYYLNNAYNAAISSLASSSLKKLGK
jgi:hypothetical protein